MARERVAGQLAFESNANRFKCSKTNGKSFVQSRKQKDDTPQECDEPKCKKKWIALLQAVERELMNRKVPIVKEEVLKEEPAAEVDDGFIVKKVAGICCHHCQRGKELVRCSQPACRLHYCTECLKRCYPDLSIEDCKERCPRCQGICNCKYALRMDKRCNKVPQDVGAVPTYTKDVKAKFDGYLWSHLVENTNVCQKILEEEWNEVQIDSEQLDGVQQRMEDVPVLHDAGYRVVCSRCNTSIVNILRTCNACGYDLCPQCCMDVRLSQNDSSTCASKSQNELHCPCKLDKSGDVCHSKLKLMRLQQLSKKCVSTLFSPKLDSAWTKECTYNKEGVTSVCYISADFLRTSEGFAHFQLNWRRGCPFVIHNVKGKMLWTPHLMKRAATEKRKGEYTADVIDCSAHQVMEVSIEAFFNGYTGETTFEGNPMYKLKDWPTEEAFKDRLRRLFYDFIDMLPLKEYTHPTSGPLNLACKVPEEVTYKPDLGPKCYIGYGREEEEQPPNGFLQIDGDSVTKLHLDVADAINILVHCQSVEGKTGDEREVNGALWHIFKREDTTKLRSFLSRHKNKFLHNGKSVEIVDPLLDQTFYLSTLALNLLSKEEGIKPLEILQKANDAIVIPAGCVHQVRNLSSCIKVAMDFVSPESIGQILSLTETYRKLPDDHFAKNDKVQAKLMVLNAAWHVLRSQSSSL